MSLATWVLFSQGFETLCLPTAILCSTEPVSARQTRDITRLSGCFLSINFFVWIWSVAILLSGWQGFNF